MVAVKCLRLINDSIWFYWINNKSSCTSFKSVWIQISIRKTKENISKKNNHFEKLNILKSFDINYKAILNKRKNNSSIDILIAINQWILVKPLIFNLIRNKEIKKIVIFQLHTRYIIRPASNKMLYLGLTAIKRSRSRSNLMGKVIMRIKNFIKYKWWNWLKILLLHKCICLLLFTYTHTSYSTHAGIHGQAFGIISHVFLINI